ncbi:hypothetical protein HYQ46_006803 [Verticillium longisporum]|nr:hypothetical protein HYQ46_006803 [Verticillium longisporum]
MYGGVRRQFDSRLVRGPARVHGSKAGSENRRDNLELETVITSARLPRSCLRRAAWDQWSRSEPVILTPRARLLSIPRWWSGAKLANIRW